MSVGDFSDADVAAWMQGKSPEEVAAAAAYYGFDANTIQDAYKIAGQDVSKEAIQDYATQHGYQWTNTNGGLDFRSPAARNAYTDSNNAKRDWMPGSAKDLNDWVKNRPVYLGNATNPNDPSQQLSTSQIKDWFANNPNPTTEQLGQLASQFHMTPENVAAALSIGTGVTYDPQKVRDIIGAQSAYRIENDGMISAPGHRSNGLNGAPGQNQRFAQYGPDGKGYRDGWKEGDPDPYGRTWAPRRLNSNGTTGPTQRGANIASPSFSPDRPLGNVAFLNPAANTPVTTDSASGALSQLAAQPVGALNPLTGGMVTPVGSMGALMKVISGQKI